jgi:hypothetical protein
MPAGQVYRHEFSALSCAVNYGQRVLQLAKALMRTINTFSTCARAILDMQIQNLSKVTKLYIKLKIMIFKVKFEFPSNLHTGTSTERE